MTTLLLRLTAAIFPLALLFFPQAGAQGARTGLALCASTLIPNLFPAIVALSLALELGLGRWLERKLSPVMGPLFHLSGACAAPLIAGLLGGYPLGAQTLRGLLDRGECSREEGQRLLLFCNNSGPAFLVGVVGSAVLGRATLGLFLWGVHALSALLVGFLLRGGERAPSSASSGPPGETPRSAGALPRAVRQGLSAILQISAYVVLFQVIAALLAALPFPSLPWGSSFRALALGLLEVTGGVTALTEPLSLPGRLALASFLLGWGGLCVHCQAAALLEETGLLFAPYLLAKLLHGLTAACLTLILLPLFPALGGAEAALPPSLLLLLPLLLLLAAKRGRKGQGEGV